MALGVYRRAEAMEYERTRRGLLGRTPAFRWDFGIGHTGDAPVEFPNLTAAPQSDGNMCVQGSCLKEQYRVHCGFRVKDASSGAYVNGWTQENSIPSSNHVDIQPQNVSADNVSSVDFGNVYFYKLDVRSDLLRAISYTDGAGPVTLAMPAALGTVYPVRVGQNGVNAIPGNAATWGETIVTRSNAIHFINMKESTSVRVTINGGAPVTVNIDTDGLGELDLAGIAFPFTAKYEVFTGQNLTGRKQTQFFVRDSYGGDVIGRSRIFIDTAPFSPKTAKGCLLWLNPDKLVGANGAAVNTFPDDSGGARDFTKFGAAPTIDSASFVRPVVNFAGQTMWRAIPELLVNPLTWIMVLRPGATGGWGYFSLMKNAGGSGGFNVNANGGVPISIFTQIGGGQNTAVPNMTNGALQLLWIEFTPGATPQLTVYRNGNAAPEFVSSKTLAFSASPAASLGSFYADEVGSPLSVGSFKCGDVVAYGKILSAAKRQALADWLRTRWGNAW